MSGPRTSLAKVMIAGASGVGKTSLVNSLVFQGFHQVSPTIGVNFAQKVCTGNEGPVNLSIWDLSGHSRFQCLMPRFCRGAMGVLLVFDLSDESSLEAAANWLERIKSYVNSVDDFAVVLVGNKSDLPVKVSQEQIEAFCSAHRIRDYLPCSAKSGENIKLTFEVLCSAIQRHFPILAELSKALIST